MHHSRLAPLAAGPGCWLLATNLQNLRLTIPDTDLPSPSPLSTWLAGIALGVRERTERERERDYPDPILKET